MTFRSHCVRWSGFSSFFRTDMKTESMKKAGIILSGPCKQGIECKH